MKKTLYLLAAIFLATVFMAACGGDPKPTSTIETQSAPLTTEPTDMATDMATEIPADIPAEIPAETPAPVSDPAPSITPDAQVSGEGAPSTECPQDGTLDDAAAISSCSALAVPQIRSFSFNAEIDLLALFPIGPAPGGQGSLQLSGSMIQPDRLQFQMSIGPKGQTTEFNGIMIGNDTYVQEPETNQWFKGTPPDDEFLASLQMVGMLMLPSDPAIYLSGTVDLDDGSTAYLMVSDQPAQESRGGFPFGPGSTVTRAVDVKDFLTKEVRVTAEGLDGEIRDFITIRYHGYNEPTEIEPPADYLPLPDEAMDPDLRERPSSWVLHTATTAMPK